MSFYHKLYMFLLALMILILVAIYIQAQHINNNLTAFSGWIQTNFNPPEYEEDNSSR